MVRLTKMASKLNEAQKDSLVVGIDCEDYKILIKSHRDITTAIYKKH